MVDRKDRGVDYIMDLDEIEHLLLKYLSFFEPLSMDKLLLEISEYDMIYLGNLTLEDFDQALKSLCKKGRLKRMGRGRDSTWLRINPHKLSVWKKVFYRLFR